MRERFLQTCFDEGVPGERAVFHNWKHKVVDWKWAYMEEVFTRLSPAISLFLLRYDEQKIKKPIGHVEADGTIVPNCLAKITKAKPRTQLLWSWSQTRTISTRDVKPTSMPYRRWACS